jgi:transposase
MEWTLRTRDELLTLFATEPEPTADAVLALQEAFVALAERLPELERQVNQTSQNSHQPPSKDDVFNPPPPKPKSLRGKSGRASGGQVGHPGAHLEMCEEPDQVIPHVPTQCPRCGTPLAPTDDLLAADYIDRRQVFDLKMVLEVTEHRTLAVVCEECGEETVGAFPSTVPAPVQYGPGVHTFLTYGHIYQLLPADRLCEMFEDLTGSSISQGTLFRTTERLYEGLAHYEEEVKQEILQAPVVHFDESGARVGKKLHWLHVASTDRATYYRIHRKRGEEAMTAMGILPHYLGTAVHDAWAPYRKYRLSKDGLCNQHHERELQGIIDQDHQTWDHDLITHLHTIKKARESAILGLRRGLSRQAVMP